MKNNPSEHEFDEQTDDEELTISNDDRVAMEIVECMIKCVDQYKFQIAMPFRHINPNMQNNRQHAELRLYQQRRMLCKNAEVKSKYIEKIKCLKDEGYIECVLIRLMIL